MTKSLYFLLMTLLLRSSFTAGSPVYQESLASRHDVVQAGIRPRSEIDLTTEKQVLFCAGQNKSLECVSPGSTIAIMDTFWGRLTDKICPSEDGDPTTSCGSDSSTTPLLKKLCDDKVFCEIPARHTVLQAPGTTHCPGVNKYLIVNYTCIPVERKFVLCDGETTNLNCGEGWKLNILSAIWGRMSPATCATTLGRPSRLGKCDNSNSTLEKVRSICHGRNGCIVRADDGHMIEGNAQHCPDVDKYAVISYRCQPRVEQESFLNSDQGMAPDSTKTISFVNHDSQFNEYHSTPHLQATPPNTPSPQQPNQNPESSLDGLLKEYMESQKNKDDTTTGEQLSVPHDVGPPPHPKEKLSVPQDGAKGGIQQNIDLLEKILHSKNLMKVGIDAMEGIDMATAVNEPHGSKGPKNNHSIAKQLDLTRDELNHLAHSPDAIKIINEYMNKNKTSQATRLIVSQQTIQGSKQTSTSKLTSASSNSNSFTAQNEAFGTNGNKESFDTKGSGKLSSTTATTQKPSPITTSETTVKDLSKVMDPTAKLGGKVMGNMFYDKYLKPEQEHLENQAKNGDKNAEEKAIGILRTKVSALQAISDALSLITSKIDQAEGGGKRHHAGKKTSKQQEGNTVHADGSDSVQPKDVQFLQDKINKAIETTEAMERQAAIKHPSLVALKLRGKVAQDVQAETRNNVEQRKERLKIDKQIKDIEDSFNMLIEKAEKSGKFSDRDINKKLPTRNLFEELQSGALKMPFNDEPTRKPDNSVKGIYGFEVVSQEPVINVIKEKDNSTQSNKINTSNTTINAFKKAPEEVNVHTPLDAPRAKEPSATVKVAPQTASKAANSIANALRRQASNQSLYTVALKPITTFNNIQDVTLGGRINSEVLKEKKKEKLYQGKDVGAILNMIKAQPTTKATLVQPANQPLIPAKDMKMTGNNIQSLGGKEEQAAKVQTVGTLDEKSATLLSVLVQGFLEHNKNDNKIQTRHRRKKKKKKKMEQTEPEDEDFVIGAKHDKMGKNKDSQTSVLDNDLLEMLEQQLSNAQKYGYKIENLVSDIQDNEGEEDETVKSVPTDKEKEKELSEDGRLLSPTNKPMPAPSDDPSIELISKYTEGKSLQSMLLALQKMLKQAKPEIEKDKKVGTSSAELITEESASKNSLSTKPHVVEFSEAATSGKIVNSLDEGKVSENKDIQKVTQFAGGRILEPASTTGMKAVSQQTFSVINSNPTTKSSVGATQDNKPTSKIKLAKLVKGVKLLLKALRGRNLESHFGRHHEGKLEESDDQDGKDDGFDSETHEDFNENLLRDKENRKQAESERYNGFFDFTEPRHKESSKWYVGEGNSYKTKSYQYDEQYDTNLAQQFASNPKEYSTFTPNIYSGPYTSFALQPSNSYGYSDKQALQDPFEKPVYKLPGPAKHALNSALKNDPIIQAVEEFSDKESQLYNEKLQGIQKNRIPRKNITQN